MEARDPPFDLGLIEAPQRRPRCHLALAADRVRSHVAFQQEVVKGLRLVLRKERGAQTIEELGIDADIAPEKPPQLLRLTRSGFGPRDELLRRLAIQHPSLRIAGHLRLDGRLERRLERARQVETVVRCASMIVDATARCWRAAYGPFSQMVTLRKVDGGRVRRSPAPGMPAIAGEIIDLGQFLAAETRLKAVAAATISRPCSIGSAVAC